ncbi:DUF2652 domain-containing protein [Spongiimicrobium salis]|uniref:DUF2652 domain-containing protein n=1 Tax=Spongiimicrobium salis TaxID=1667022 RepID=UPI00374DCF52
MKKNALYFMPDISGFTNFVHANEIEHSKHIISELLEALIDTDTMNLQLAEIEGDALFMYTLDIPSFATVMEQSQKMLEEFSYQIAKYETQRICQCGACINASNLKIKFIIHYGEISFMRVKHMVKPYGIDVIKTHRLLKNSVSVHQYILISSETLDYWNVDTAEFPSFKAMQDDYDLGKAVYMYKDLSQFKISSEKTIQKIGIQKPDSPPAFHFSTVLEANVSDAYTLITDFSIRTSWYKLVDDLLFDAYRINRVGTRHNCISGSSIYKVATLGGKTKEEQLVYGEKTEDIEHLETFSYYMTLNAIAPEKTCLTTEVFFTYSTKDPGIQHQIRRTLDHVWSDSLDRLAALFVPVEV